MLNPITVRGRAFLLENIMQSTYPIARKFEEVAIPTTLLYGKDNMYIGKHEMHILAHYIEVCSCAMVRLRRRRCPTDSCLRSQAAVIACWTTIHSNC